MLFLTYLESRASQLGHTEISCSAILNMACKILQARLGLAKYTHEAEAEGISGTVSQLSSRC